jgi:MurNAc alpha-1-phosphate uridylyltransferase
MADPIRFQAGADRPDVMLLAAGRGLRLLPLTETRPKPLLEIGGVALLDRVVAAAAAEGFTRFVVNAHHRADQLVAHLDALAGRFPEARFRISREPELLETGGGVKQALPLLDTDAILVMNTDAFWLAGAGRPLVRLLDRLSGADIVLLCAQPRRAHGFGRSHDFCLDPRGRVTRDSGQPVIYAGVALLGRALLEAVPETRFSLYPLFMAALDRDRLAGVVLDADWFHVGDPAGLAEAGRVLAALA